MPTSPRPRWPGLVLALAFLAAACGPAATPAPTAPAPTAPTAPAPVLPPAPAPGPTPAPGPASYHAQNQAFGVLRGFTVPAVARRPPYKLVHVACGLDETVAAPAHRCHVVGAAAARAAYPDGEQSPLLRWLRSSVGLVDGKAPPGLAAAVARGLDGGEPHDPGHAWVIAITVTRTYQYDEAIATGCEHAGGHPCDPVARLTGRKLRGKEVSGPYYVHGGRALDLDVGLDEVLAMVGAAVVYQPVELGLVFGDSTSPYLDLLQQAMVEGAASGALAELARVNEPDPVVRQILAYDRAVLAARLGDHDATVAAIAALEAALPARGQPAPGLDTLLAAAMPFLDRVKRGELVFTPPAGLDAFIGRRW